MRWLPLIRLHPDAAHLRLDLAMAVGAHAAAGPVAQGLRAIHRAGHAGRAQHALAAHLAVEQRALDRLLDGRDRPLQALVADRDGTAGAARFSVRFEDAIEARSSRAHGAPTKPDRIHQEDSAAGSARGVGAARIDALRPYQALQILVGDTRFEARGFRGRLGLKILAAGRAARCAANRRDRHPNCPCRRASPRGRPPPESAATAAPWPFRGPLDDDLRGNVAPGNDDQRCHVTASSVAPARLRFTADSRLVLHIAVAGLTILELQAHAGRDGACRSSDSGFGACAEIDQPAGNCRNRPETAPDAGRARAPASPAVEMPQQKIREIERPGSASASAANTGPVAKNS